MCFSCVCVCVCMRALIPHERLITLLQNVELYTCVCVDTVFFRTSEPGFMQSFFFFSAFISFKQITCLSCIHRHRKVSAGTYHCKREGMHLNLPSSTFYDQTPRHKKGIFHYILHLLSVWPTSVLFPLFSRLFSLSRGYLQTPFQIHSLLSVTLTLCINEKLHFLAN